MMQELELEYQDEQSEEESLFPDEYDDAAEDIAAPRPSFGAPAAADDADPFSDYEPYPGVTKVHLQKKIDLLHAAEERLFASETFDVTLSNVSPRFLREHKRGELVGRAAPLDTSDQLERYLGGGLYKLVDSLLDEHDRNDNPTFRVWLRMDAPAMKRLKTLSRAYARCVDDARTDSPSQEDILYPTQVGTVLVATTYAVSLGKLTRLGYRLTLRATCRSERSTSKSRVLCCREIEVRVATRRSDLKIEDRLVDDSGLMRNSEWIRKSNFVVLSPASKTSGCVCLSVHGDANCALFEVLLHLPSSGGTALLASYSTRLGIVFSLGDYRVRRQKNMLEIVAQESKKNRALMHHPHLSVRSAHECASTERIFTELSFTLRNLIDFENSYSPDPEAAASSCSAESLFKRADESISTSDENGAATAADSDNGLFLSLIVNNALKNGARALGLGKTSGAAMEIDSELLWDVSWRIRRLFGSVLLRNWMATMCEMRELALESSMRIFECENQPRSLRRVSTTELIDDHANLILYNNWMLGPMPAPPLAHADGGAPRSPRRSAASGRAPGESTEVGKLPTEAVRLPSVTPQQTTRMFNVQRNSSRKIMLEKATKFSLSSVVDRSKASVERMIDAGNIPLEIFVRHPVVILDVARLSDIVHKSLRGAGVPPDTVDALAAAAKWHNSKQ